MGMKSVVALIVLAAFVNAFLIVVLWRFVAKNMKSKKKNQDKEEELDAREVALEENEACFFDMLEEAKDTLRDAKKIKSAQQKRGNVGSAKVIPLRSIPLDNASEDDSAPTAKSVDKPKSWN